MKRLIPFLILSVFTASTSFAQNSDAGLWTGIEVEKTIVKGLDVSLEEEMRLHENFSQIKTTFTELGTSYRFNKYVRAGLSYRYIQRNDNGFGTRHRLSGQLTLRYKSKPLIFSWRTRFQRQNNEPFMDSNERIPAKHNRNKLQLKLDLDKPFMPYVALELWTPLGSPESGTIDNVRFSMGTEIKLGENSELQVGYIYDSELYGTPALKSHIIALSYSFTLSGCKKNKKEKEIDVPDIRPSVD